MAPDDGAEINTKFREIDRKLVKPKKIRSKSEDWELDTGKLPATLEELVGLLVCFKSF